MAHSNFLSQLLHDRVNRLEDYVMTMMRTKEGISLNLVQEEFGRNVVDSLVDVAKRFVDMELLTLDDKHIKCRGKRAKKYELASAVMTRSTMSLNLITCFAFSYFPCDLPLRFQTRMVFSSAILFWLK